MTEISSNQYDSDGVGDGTLTQVIQYVDSTSGDNRVTDNYYDWRDRLVCSKSGVASSESDGTHRPITVFTLDNLGRATTRQSYDGDGVTPSTNSDNTFSGLPSGSSSKLRTQIVTGYDDQNRVYQTAVYSVDQSSGSPSSAALVTNNYYDHRGDLIEVSMPGGQVQKTVFDGVERVGTQYVTNGAGGTSWSDPASPSGDLVLTQAVNTYDGDNNLTQTTKSDRFHSDTTTAGVLTGSIAHKLLDSLL